METEKIQEMTEGFARVRANIGEALSRRRPGVGITDRVQLLGASKTVPAEEILFAAFSRNIDLWAIFVPDGVV